MHRTVFMPKHSSEGTRDVQGDLFDHHCQYLLAFGFAGSHLGVILHAFTHACQANCIRIVYMLINDI